MGRDQNKNGRGAGGLPGALRSKRRYVYGSLLILTLWQAASSLGWCNPYLLPPPAKVLRALIQMAAQGQLLRHVGSSLARVAAGFSLAFLLACLLALGCVLAPRASQWYDGPLRIIRTIPPLSLVPMVILWVGLGEESKVLLILLSAFFPIYMNAQDGLLRCDEKLLEVGRTFGYSPAEQLWRIRVPAAVPHVVAGMRVGLGYSWRALVGAEMLAATSGLGYYILDAQAMARTDKVLAGIVVIAAVGFLSDVLFDWAAAKLMPRG
ncbi:MAG: ABC transporter permease [Oscillospiraceae bacterium]